MVGPDLDRADFSHHQSCRTRQRRISSRKPSLEVSTSRYGADPRHWNRRPTHHRHGSSSSFTSCSSISIRTPDLEERPHATTFGHALNLLLESDNNFKDWITEAKRNPIPSLSLPDTPIADVEIRLVEPTPVPSRVGSLGASMASTLLGVKTSWSPEPTVPEKPQGKFYLPSSPTKDSSEDDSSRTSDQPRPHTRRKTSLEKGKHRKKQPVKFAQPEEDEWSDEPEEDEGQKKREMFAKQQIFGGSSQGLLSGIFRTGGSMVDLTKAPDKPGLRSCPTHGDLTSLASSPAQTILRSKSAVAMPLQSGVSVTSRGTESFDEATDDDYLATSSTQKKLDELSKRRPVPPRLDERGVVLPDSPTTRRRAIIMREMSESLRRSEQSPGVC